MSRFARRCLLVALVLRASIALADDVVEQPSPGFDGYVEAIGFEEVLPNEPGEWTVRATMVAEREAATVMGASRVTNFVPSAQLNFGIVDRLSGDIEVPFAMRSSADGRDIGLGNLCFGLAYLVRAQDKALPHLTALLEVHVPTASEHVMERETEVQAAWGLAVVQPRFVVQATIGVAATFGETSSYSLVDNLSVAVALPARMHLFAELLAETRLPTLDLELLAGPGLQLPVTRTLYVAASAMFGLRDTPGRATVQVQYEF